MPAMKRYKARLNRITDRQSLHPISLSEYAHDQERQRKSFSDGRATNTHIWSLLIPRNLALPPRLRDLRSEMFLLPFSEYKK